MNNYPFSDVLQSIITLLSVIVACIAIVAANYNNKRQIIFANRNNKRQILTGKLEELFQAIYSLDKYYGIFMPLWYKLKQQRDPKDNTIKTLDEYYKERDFSFPIGKRKDVEELLSRIDVLTECYTEGDLKKEIDSYISLMFAFFELISAGGSVYQELNWPSGFPDYNDFYKKTKGVKDNIVTTIKKL